MRGLAVALALAAPAALPSLARAAPDAAASTSCSPEDGLNFICNIKVPEDIVSVPGTPWVVSGSMTADGTGGLYLVDPKTHAAERLYPSATAKAKLNEKNFPDCAGPPDPAHFSAHGLGVRSRGPGLSTIYVVGHGGREAIEVFDVDAKGGKPEATWVGCVMSPKNDVLVNAVAGMGNGELMITTTYEAPFLMKDVGAGKITGWVYTRKAGQPLTRIPGTNLSGNNGLEVSPDHKQIYVAATGSHQVVRYDLADTSKPSAVIDLDFRPDNVRWAPNGKLLAAGESPAANCPADQKCPATINVVEIDPVTLSKTVLYKKPTTKSFAGISDALIADHTLWLGAHGGDRIAYQALGK